MKINWEVVKGFQPLSRASRDDVAFQHAIATLFDGRERIHALVNSSSLPMPGSWIDAQTQGALPLLDLNDPKADDVMPYLLPLSPEDMFLRSALTAASPPSAKALWASRAVIFINQDQPTASLYSRIRRNLIAPDASRQNHFLRFWDADVVLDLLDAVAFESVGFRGPFAPDTRLFIPQKDDTLLKVTLQKDQGEPDGAPIILTPALRERLAFAVERKAADAMLHEILSGTDGGGVEALLRRSYDLLLGAGWPLRAMPPVLRVVARYGIASNAMPPAAREILDHPTMSHTARGRVLEHEAPTIFADAAANNRLKGRDFWLISES